MSIQSEIDRLTAAKASIAASLQAMGVAPPEGTTLEQYAAQLAAIAAAAPWLPLAGGVMKGPLTLDGDPIEDNQAATKHYVDEHAGGAASATAVVTLSASGWTGSAAPYIQQVACSIVAADTKVVVIDPDTTGSDADANKEILWAWPIVCQKDPVQGAGTLTFYAEEIPSINIPVKVGVC